MEKCLKQFLSKCGFKKPACPTFSASCPLCREAEEKHAERSRGLIATEDRYGSTLLLRFHSCCSWVLQSLTVTYNNPSKRSSDSICGYAALLYTSTPRRQILYFLLHDNNFQNFSYFCRFRLLKQYINSTIIINTTVTYCYCYNFLNNLSAIRQTKSNYSLPKNWNNAYSRQNWHNFI